MALKPDRSTEAVDVSYYINSITGPSTTRMERGGILCADNTLTPGSGGGMDSAGQAAQYAANPSGLQALGILMNDFVNIDQSRQILNPYRDESQIGTKATILRRGFVVTNMLSSSQVATGNTMPVIAYAGYSGTITNFNLSGLPIIGQFQTKQDADGYAKVAIAIP